MNTTYAAKAPAVYRLVGTGILTALVIVLQVFASGIRIGPFTPTLTLIPIIIGAVLYGPLTGAFLGAVFGLVVVIAVISGAEPFSLLMLNMNPVATVLTCLIKGAVAGFFPGLVYKLISPKNSIVALLAAALVAPIANTGIFCAAMLTIFRPLLESTAEGANPVTFLLVAFVGINFLFELLFDIILAPVVVRILNAIRKNG